MDKSVNKALFVERLRTRHGNHFTAEQAVEAVFDLIVRELAGGSRVSITGFGALDVRKMHALSGYNPATGEGMERPERHWVRFRAGQNLIDLVNSVKVLPEWDSAIRKARKGTLTKGADKS